MTATIPTIALVLCPIGMGAMMVMMWWMMRGHGRKDDRGQE